MALTEQERRERDYQIGQRVYYQGKPVRIINYARDDDDARWVQDGGGNTHRVHVDVLSTRKPERDV